MVMGEMDGKRSGLVRRLRGAENARRHGGGKSKGFKFNNHQVSKWKEKEVSKKKTIKLK